MMNVSKNFILQEFIPEEIWDRFGPNAIWFVDPRIIRIAQFIRDMYGLPVTINNWHNGGKYKESGFRLPTTKTGAKLSQHKFGRAIDIKFLDKPNSFYKEVREDIKKHEEEFIKLGVTAVEEGTKSWLHVDCRYTGLDTILFIPYYKKKK